MEGVTRPRSLLPDGPFHVISNAVEDGVLFTGDADRRFYLGLLQQVVERHRWRVFTFAQMTTHVHLLIWTTTASLSKGMWWLNWKYADWFKAGRPGHKGHVFGGPFDSRPIGDEHYLLAVLRYIALNPVRAQMVARTQAWAWSSDRLLRAGSRDLSILAVKDALAFFDDDPRAYAAFVDGVDPPDHDLVVRCVDGPPEDRPALQDLPAEPTAGDLARAHREWGYTLREIAEHVGVHHTTVLRRIERA